MKNIVNIGFSSKEELYNHLELELKGLLMYETDIIANLSNSCALIFHSLKDVNWVGFYLHKQGELVLGPFQGRPACVRIKIGKGVCGRAALRMQTVLVTDVHKFDGHIACDSASNSEIVIPIIIDHKLFGVLDVDSPLLNRFDDSDKYGLERLVEVIEETIVLSSL